MRTVEDTVEGQESDDALMARFCRGDEAAFGVLYDRYAPQLEAFLRRLVRDQTLAEDLLQTTFLSFVRARGRYVATAGLRAWIFSIAANAGRDALRRRGARGRRCAVAPHRRSALHCRHWFRSGRKAGVA